MKNKIIILLAFIFCISCFLPYSVALANSGPMTGGATSDHFELLALKDEDISVESEILTFDFSQSSGTPISKTTALYDMRNAGQDKTLTMGFPLVSTINTFKNWTAEIKLDEVNINYTPYFAFVEANNIVNLTFEDILEGINSLEKLDAQTLGYMYKLDINWNELKVEFDINTSNSFVVHNFSTYNYEEIQDQQGIAHIKIEEEFDKVSADGKPYFYVIGEDLTNLKIRKWSSSNGLWEDYSLEISEKTTPKLSDFIYSLEDNMTEGELNLICAKLLEYKYSVHLAKSESELINAIYNTQCLIVLGYEVTIKGNNAPNMLSVSYNMGGRFSNYYKPTLYSYNYISSPAKNWVNFGTFVIKIITPSDNPYVVNANLNYNKVADNSYQYAGDGIPKGNIEFSLCASEKPDYNKSGWGPMRSVWLTIGFWGIVGLCVLGIVIAGIVIIARR